MNFSQSEQEFATLREFCRAHLKKLNMGQLQNVTRYLMDRGYGNPETATPLSRTIEHRDQLIRENDKLKEKLKEMREWLGGASDKLKEKGVDSPALERYLAQCDVVGWPAWQNAFQRCEGCDGKGGSCAGCEGRGFVLKPYQKTFADVSPQGWWKTRAISLLLAVPRTVQNETVMGTKWYEQRDELLKANEPVIPQPRNRA